MLGDTALTDIKVKFENQRGLTQETPRQFGNAHYMLPTISKRYEKWIGNYA